MGTAAPTEITNWREKTHLALGDEALGGRTPASLWVGSPLGKCPPRWQTSTCTGSDLRRLTSLSPPQLPPLRTGIDDALPCGL